MDVWQCYCTLICVKELLKTFNIKGDCFEACRNMNVQLFCFLRKTNPNQLSGVEQSIRVHGWPLVAILGHYTFKWFLQTDITKTLLILLVIPYLWTTVALSWVDEQPSPVHYKVSTTLCLLYRDSFPSRGLWLDEGFVLSWMAAFVLAYFPLDLLRRVLVVVLLVPGHRLGKQEEDRMWRHVKRTGCDVTQTPLYLRRSCFKDI